MKSLHKILAISVLATAAGSAMAADQTVVTDEGVSTFSFFKPAAVRAEVGTTGYGGAISWSANPYVGVTLGYNGGDISWTDDLSVNGTKYDLDMDNNLTYLNAEIRPWANWFYMAAGVAYIDNDYDLSKRIGAGETLSIDGNQYQLAPGATEGRVNGQLSYKNNIAPYVGIGFSPAITDRWGVFGEIGAYYNGNPQVNLTASGLAPVEGSPSVESVIEEEERAIRNDNEYEWLPVAKLGVSFRF
ncbi:ornithine uptake porin CarO type 6 [Acinetobacter indicus]|uniref:ornithine uptake porin CarO type 6 n=1 Tax=Acinetobacter TaxID=469 RepID=UPI0015D3602E|nr:MULTISPECIES: ornithine uptake porin CarO type 6 [Acinetobacter]MCP0916834.1 ornithine uptake porin CarO type 6 [Acinetobacter indicus]MCP0919947.1 ornithine uptake porin CarO type 6 [Acinetobacter indicus]MCP0922614.1 ornithine uptake porin CarO type 6 [Acinetobacter indicus]